MSFPTRNMAEEVTNWAEIEATFAGADMEENWRAMFKTTEVFGRLASEVGAHLGYTYPIELDQNVTAHLKKVQSMYAEQLQN